MNKPTQQTISDLRSALQDLTFTREKCIRPLGTPVPVSLCSAEEKIQRVLDQLTRDDALLCPRCPVTKPTRRALAAHVSMTHGGVA